MQEKKNEKKFDSKRKEHFYLNFSSIATLKNKDMIFYVNFVSWAYISILVNSMYFLFLLFVNTCHDHELIRVKH